MRGSERRRNGSYTNKIRGKREEMMKGKRTEGGTSMRREERRKER